MKKILFFCVLATIATSCYEEDLTVGPSTTLNLNLNATFNEENLEMNKAYDYDGKSLQFNRFDFFLSGVVLLVADNDDEVDLFDLSFVDFTDADGQAVVIPSYKVPVGSYKGIRLSFGVPADLNKSSTSSYGAGHPLKVNFDTHYWPDAKSFIFLKSEGVFDLDNDGVFGALPNDHPFQHGPAKNSNYTTLTLLSPITLKENEPFDLNMLIDLYKLYSNGTSVLDFSDENSLNTADPDDQTLASYLMNNLQNAVSLKP